MPDKDGRIKPIHIRHVPWHEKEQRLEREVVQPAGNQIARISRDELAIQAKMLEAWKREQGTSGVHWPD